jgi:hypothetical protein
MGVRRWTLEEALREDVRMIEEGRGGGKGE